MMGRAGPELELLAMMHSSGTAQGLEKDGYLSDPCKLRCT